MYAHEKDKENLVSIIIPAFKQEKTIRRDVENIHNVMSQTRWEFEIVIVADGLLDRTYEEASRIVLPNVHVYGYEKNRGKGYAVRFGMARATGDIIAFIDAGMDINPNGISMLLEHMEWYDADVIVGSKRHPVSKVNYPIIRKIYSSTYHFLVFLLFGLKIRDTQTGLKIYKRDVLEKVLPRLLVNKFAFDIEILAVSYHLGFRKIFEAPIYIEWSEKNTSFTPFLIFDRQIQNMLVDTFAVFYRMFFLRYYDDISKRDWVSSKELQVSKKLLLQRIKFSIIIPVRQVNSYVRESIEKIKELYYKNYEVIIVSDTEEDLSWCNDKRFKIISSGSAGPGTKRNMAARISSGDILVFLDDDAYPDKDWLNCAYEIFLKNDIYALGGPALTPLDASFLEKMSGYIYESIICSGGTTYRYLPKLSRNVSDYPTVNLFVTREAFFAVGGFIEDYWPGEDTKFCLDLIDLYKKDFYYDSTVIVYHHRRQLFSPHLKQVQRYGWHRGAFVRLFPRTSRLPMYFAPSIFVVGLIFGPLLCLFSNTMCAIYYYSLTIYLSVLFLASFVAVIKSRNFLAFPYFAIGAFLTHLTYGSAFIVGLFKSPELKLRGFDRKTGSYIGG